MPLTIGTGEVPPSPAPPPVVPASERAAARSQARAVAAGTNLIEDVGTISASWIDPEGTVWPLSNISDSTGWFLRPGITGWGATDYELVTDPLSRGGEMLRFVRANPARIHLPLHVFGGTHNQFVSRLRAIKRAFTMTLHRRAPGVLQIKRPDGSTRVIECYYQEGFEGEGGAEDWVFANPVVTLYAPDGYWRDLLPQQISRGHVTAASYLGHYPRISSSQGLNDTIVINPGDVVAWPRWQVTGPMTMLVATNNTTGESFTVQTALTAGDSIYITTSQPTIRDAAGTNLAGTLNWPEAVLWGLLPGPNEVDFAISGSGLGSGVQLEFYARYEGA